MKRNIFRVILIIILALLLIFVNMPFARKSESKVFTLPGLPRPIAKVPVVITSAGQSTDTYIINDIANQLMIRSYFMPQADDEDLEDINTIVFVVGYSSLSTKLQGISYEDEKIRIGKLLDRAEKFELKVITVVLGCEQPTDERNEEILKLIGDKADYIIGLKRSSNEKLIVELAEESNIPLTLVSDVNDISQPFVSAFR